MLTKSHSKMQILPNKPLKRVSFSQSPCTFAKNFKLPPQASLKVRQPDLEALNSYFPTATKIINRKLPLINKNPASQNIRKHRKALTSIPSLLEPIKFCEIKDLKNNFFNISFSSKTGVKKLRPKPYNQDRILVLSEANQHILAVFDGHGQEGHLISSFIQQNLTNLFSELLQLSRVKDPVIYFSSFFTEYISNLSLSLKNSPLNSVYSGSTFLSVFIHNDICVCTNLGDSKAILITYDRIWQSRQLNQLHKPSEKSEKNRILRSGGIIGQALNEQGNPSGPLRVMTKSTNGLGLALTRAIGDSLFKESGVCDIPDVTSFKLRTHDKCLIVASDGLWDYIDDSFAVDIVKKHWSLSDPGLIVEELIKKAYEKAGTEDVDDMSVVVALRE